MALGPRRPGESGKQHKRREIIERRCWQKTVRGNVFASWEKADDRAFQINRRRGAEVVAFCCKHCGLWHVGNPVKNQKGVRDGRLGEEPGSVRVSPEAAGAPDG